MTPINGVTAVADYFRRVEMSGRWRLGGLPPEDLPMPELLAAVYFAAFDPLPRCGLFRDRGLTGRQPSGPESLLITAGATRAPRWLILDQLSRCCWQFLQKWYALRGLASRSRVPEET